AVGGGLAVGAVCCNEVPLIDDDHNGAAAFVRVAADGGVGCGDAFGGVDDEERDVGGLKMAAGHDDGKLLGHEVGFALAADSGGVDDAELLAVVFDDFIHGVTRGSGNGGNDGARGPGERI